MPSSFIDEVVKILKLGGVGVFPTDTLYGVLGSALRKKTVERIYKLKGRSPQKPLIILISSLKDLSLFNIRLGIDEQKVLKRFWPGKVSVILKSDSKNIDYLTRGTNSLAFRLPKNKNLINLIKKTGPLVAPSANPEGKPPAENIKEAIHYFSDDVDFYFDGGTLKGDPSVLISLVGGEIKILRGNIKSIKIKPL